MQTKRIRPLRSKIALTIIIVVLVSLLCVGAVFLINTGRLSSTLIESNNKMSQTSRSMSSSSMEDLTRVRLQELAADKADIADRTFYEFQQAVRMIASAAEKLYEEQDLYPERDIPLPDAEKNGKLSLQILYGPDVDPEDEDIIREARLIGNLQEILYSVNMQNEDIASAYFATESGIMAQADYISGQKFDENGNILPLDAKTRPWYQGASSSKELFMTSVTRDAHTPRMGIMCGVPVFYEGKLVGVAGAGMYLDNIDSLVRSIDLGDNGNFCIVNRFGRILFSTYETGVLSTEENDTDLRLSKDPDMRGLALDALNGNNGIKQLTIDGVPCYAAYAPMKTVNWSVFVVLSKEVVEAPTVALQEGLDRISSESEASANQLWENSSLLLLIVIIAALIIALIVSLLLSKRIVSPIQKLTEEVSQLKGDDLDFNLELDTGDETQLLAESFQSLTKRTKTYINDIQKITAEKERIGTELELATRIQADMLPNSFPAFPDRKDFDVYASMTPAKEVGGDFYDFFLIDDDHLAVAIADVSGKGVPAALLMMVSMILIRSAVENGLSPAEILEKVNERLCSGNREEMFVTVWLGILDLKTGRLTAANAGHEYPIFKQAGERFRLVKDPHGFVIGGLPGEKYEEYEWQLEPGAKIFVYTDGVPEAGKTRSDLFGTDRLIDVLHKAENEDPENILAAVDAAVKDFIEDSPQFDDLTMLCLEYKGSGR